MTPRELAMAVEADLARRDAEGWRFAHFVRLIMQMWTKRKIRVEDLYAPLRAPETPDREARHRRFLRAVRLLAPDAKVIPADATPAKGARHGA